MYKIFFFTTILVYFSTALNAQSDNVLKLEKLIQDSTITYYEISVYAPKYIWVKKDNLVGLLDMDLKEVLPIEYNEVEPVCCGGNNYLIRKNENQWSFVDVENKIIHFDIKGKNVENLYLMYAEIPLFLYIDEKDKYNLLDVNGNKILDEDCDEISVCYVYYQYYQVKKKNKYGMIDNKGKILIPIDYDNIDFIDGPQDPKIILNKNSEILTFDLNEIKKNEFVIFKRH